MIQHAIELQDRQSIAVPADPGPTAAAGPTASVEPRAPASASGEASGQRPFRILLVEDHAPTVVLLARLMKRWGWEVTQAAGVKAALEAASAAGFDLVVSDLGLPDGDGHELMRQLHDGYGLRGVALSGHGMEEDVQRSLACGFVAHLVKPIDFEELKKTIAALLAGPAV